MCIYELHVEVALAVCVADLRISVAVAVGFRSVCTGGGYCGGGSVGFEPTFIWVAGWLPMGVAVAVGSDLCVLVGDGWLQFLSPPLWVAVDLDLVVVMKMCFGFLWWLEFFYCRCGCGGEDLIGR